MGEGTELKKELAVGVGRSASEGNQGAVSSAGSSQKMKAVVREESADTQEYKSCQLNDMDHNKEEFASTGWHEPKFMCDRQWQVEDEGESVAHDELRRGERKEQVVSNRQTEASSRGEEMARQFCRLVWVHAGTENHEGLRGQAELRKELVGTKIAERSCGVDT